MDTQIGYGQLRYAVWTVSYSNQIPSGYAQNRIWADSLNEALVCYVDILRERWTERVLWPASDTAFILQINLISQ